jgi:hypothetical protein
MLRIVYTPERHGNAVPDHECPQLAVTLYTRSQEPDYSSKLPLVFYTSTENIMLELVLLVAQGTIPEHWLELVDGEGTVHRVPTQRAAFSALFAYPWRHTHLERLAQAALIRRDRPRMYDDSHRQFTVG